jgi:hypothetical protein
MAMNLFRFRLAKQIIRFRNPDIDCSDQQMARGLTRPPATERESVLEAVRPPRFAPWITPRRRREASALATEADQFTY